MFIPIGDENPTERTPFVNYALIGLNIVAFLLFCLGPVNDPALIRWTMVPSDLQWPTLFTSLFLHAGWMHLIGNMVFLWIFGDNVEDRLGHIGYLVFYFACGLAADAAHILSNPHSAIPTLGASGAISGVMGTYVVLYPRAVVKTFVWLGIWYQDVFRTPAFLWIGFWFVEQVLLNVMTRGGAGVAYLAHIGGFVAGAAVGGVLLAIGARWPSSRSTPAPDDERRTGRRLFDTVPDDPDIEWLEDAADSYSLLRLNEDPTGIPTIAEVVSAATGESRDDISRRLQITRGMIVRGIAREAAAALQRDLQSRGIPSALILHGRANQPPAPVRVEGASWDDRTLRFRSGDQILRIPWSAPFLWVGARSEGTAFIDLYVNRRTAFRVSDARGVLLTEIDPSGRSEVAAGFPRFARAVQVQAASAASNEGIGIAATQEAWGRLDFPRNSDYDDYVFWLYNLILARSPRA